MSLQVQRARILIDLRKYSLAEEECRAALRLNPRDAEAHALLAQCMDRTKKRSLAIAEAKEAIACAPHWDYPYYLLAVFHQGDKQLALARENILHALRLDPHEPGYHAALSSISEDLKEPEAGLVAAENGLRIDASHADCLMWRAIHLSHLERHAESDAVVTTLLRLDPTRPEAHALRGNALLRQGKTNLAESCYREALRLKPSYGYAKGRLEAVQRGQAAATRQRPTACATTAEAKPMHAGRICLMMVWLLAFALSRVNTSVTTQRHEDERLLQSRSMVGFNTRSTHTGSATWSSRELTAPPGSAVPARVLSTTAKEGELQSLALAFMKSHQATPTAPWNSTNSATLWSSGDSRNDQPARTGRWRNEP